MGSAVYRDRTDAGRRLSQALAGLASAAPVVVGLPRGGVVVALEVARSLGAPLDVVGTRKLADPSEPDLALGAVAEGGERVVNEALVEELGLPPDAIERAAREGESMLARDVARYREVRVEEPLAGRSVVLVDDGLTTGADVLAAVRAVRRRGAARVTVAVPVSSAEAVSAVTGGADEVVCLETPPLLLSLDEWYEDLSEVSVDDVVECLRRAAVPPGAG